MGVERKMDRRKTGLNKKNNTRGETLVETIVSFSVILLLLFTITSIIRSAISMHNAAQASSAALELTCTEIESDHGSLLGTGTLHIVFPVSDPAMPDVDVEFNIKQQDQLFYFTEGSN